MRHHDRILLIALLALVAAAPASAQTTWIVDAANGPGTNFTNLPPALAVAVHGDKILVRQGLYTPGTTNQGITILGVDGALFDTGSSATVITFRVTGLPAGRTFVMKRMGNSSNVGARAPLLALDNNAGRIHLERLTLASQAPGLSPANSVLLLDRCQVASVNDCTFTGVPAIQCSSSVLSISSTTLRGNSAWQSGTTPEFVFPGYPALASVDSTVTVARSALQGGNGIDTRYGWQPGLPAASLTGGEVVLAGDAAATCSAGLSVRALGIVAVRADGVDLVLDPTLTFVPQGGAPVVGGAQKSLAWRRVPALKASGAPPGMVVTTDLYSEPGHLAVLLAGHAGDPILLGQFGRLWLDPVINLIIDVGFQDASQHRSVPIPVPMDPSLRGSPIALQALSGDALAMTLTLSTPAVVVLD